MRKRLKVLATVFAGLLGGLAATGTVSAADHRDAPALLTANGGNPQLDINDVYVFQSPANPKNTVLVMTVNPFTIPGDQVIFSTTGVYEFNLDTNGDAIEDITYEIKFKPLNRGKQIFSVTELRGSAKPKALTNTAETARVNNVPGGIKVTAGMFDDPFFFDLDAFKGFDSQGVREFNDGFENDFFEGFNISAIVLEIPSQNFGSKKNPVNNIAVWSATTEARGRNQLQVDRMGLPAINTVFIRPNRFISAAGNFKNAFNFGHPFLDVADWEDEVIDTLVFGFGNTEEYAAAVAAVVLPDMIPFDTTSAAGFLNGRRLADDVIDAELGIVTNGGLTTDSVDANDRAFRAVFPYLATPNLD